MASPLLPQHSISYKTYLKRALVEAFREVFQDHYDPRLRFRKDDITTHNRGTKVTIDFPNTMAMYPTVVVRFFERSLKNLGVGHREFLTNRDTGRVEEYKHYMYTGDAELAIFALSSYDRDLVSDSVVQVLTMGDLELYTNQFFERIYDTRTDIRPEALDHFVNINTDEIQGFGESQVATPWGEEDTVVYQTAYRVAITGEIYSLPPEYVAPRKVERVDVYEYIKELGDPEPQGDPNDPAPWQSEGDQFF
jgi:hypothetical protein